MNADKRGKLKEQQVACPFCHSSDTEMLALFGQQLMTTQHYCNNCHSAFEAVKWEESKEQAQSDKLKAESKNGGTEESRKN